MLIQATLAPSCHGNKSVVAGLGWQERNESGQSLGKPRKKLELGPHTTHYSTTVLCRPQLPRLVIVKLHAFGGEDINITRRPHPSKTPLHHVESRRRTDPIAPAHNH